MNKIGKKVNVIYVLGYLLMLFSGFISSPIFAQGIQTEFGQNRVQYKNFEWAFYNTEHFRIHFYLGGQQLGRYVIEAAEKNLKEIEKKLEYHIDYDIDILIYNNFADLKQSNIGIGINNYNTGGVTKVLGNKIFLYFDGNHDNLEKQLRGGVAKLFINDMMFGGNIQEAVQNAVLLNLPDWFIDGLVSYAAQDWNTDFDNRLRDGILSGDYEKFTKLTGVDAKFAGHSMWYYVAEVFGKNAIPNLLYLTRINRSLESGYLFVLGNTLKGSIKDWYDFYLNKYKKDETGRELPDEKQIIIEKPKKNRIYYQLKLNSDDKNIAYVTNNIGRYKVILYNREFDKSKVILRGGNKSLAYKTDCSYPVLSWAPNGNKLTVLYEKKDNTYFLHYNLKEKTTEKEKVEKFQKILDITYANNSNTLLISGINRGQSDIYTFYIPTHLVKKVTDDYYDDFSPQYIETKDKKGILFISNRPHDTLKTLKFDSLVPMEHFNLFFYDYNKKSKILLRATNTPDIKESMPFQYDNKYFTFLSDANGIRNRYLAYFDTTFSHYDTLVYYKDSVVTNPKLDSLVYLSIPNDSIESIEIVEVYKDTVKYFPVTNYSRNILEHNISIKPQKNVDMILNNGKYYFYESSIMQNMNENKAERLHNTIYRNKTTYSRMLSENIKKPIIDKNIEVEKPDTLIDSTKIDIHNYFFQSEIEIYKSNKETAKEKYPESAIVEISEEIDPEGQRTIFETGKVMPYRVRFSTDYVVSQLDNSIIFTKYDNFTGGGPVFDNQNLDPLIKIGISDLLEDYKFVGGFRIPTNISGSEYFISFENLRKRLDKKIVFYRKSESKVYDYSPATYVPVNARVKMHYVEGSLKWPFSAITSLRLFGAYRGDKITYLSADIFSLEKVDYNEDWASLRMEYVFDNTISLGTNLYDGTRFKVFGEGHKQVIEFQSAPIRDTFLHFPEPYFFVLGVDFRHYQKIHRQLIWANRLAITTSFGTRKVIYYMGGVDNWLIPRFNYNTPIPYDENFAFQALATNMRGFEQNIRNGSTYAVLNSEIRIPIFRYFNIAINSEFLKNFQIVGFGDIGTAWMGLSPFDNENTLNTEIIEHGPVKVKYDYFTNPIVQGYGMGLRATLLGYFVRGDVAWGLEDRVFSKPIYYFSLSLDF